MFKLAYEATAIIRNLPVQWIPKIELYYPDLPQFPIMYIHFVLKRKRIVACPVSVSYSVHHNLCDASFLVLVNAEPNPELIEALTTEISNRIGISNQITKETVIACCNENQAYIDFFADLWNYIEKSYGSSIPYGKFFEEIYSIVRFVSAWAPKTGRQSEMRMLYNFMSAFGEEVSFPTDWAHLEYYVIPTYSDVRNRNYSVFPKFEKLYHAIRKLYQLEYTDSVSVDGMTFAVMPTAWKPDKNSFITNVSGKYYTQGKITEEDKFFAEKLVDAFNRHTRRAAFFISAFLTIERTDYRKWTKEFFKVFYDSGKLKGYSEKVIACFLQQGFANEEVIPIDTWIETFYEYPLGIDSRSAFYDDFSMLGKLERVIWLSSQSNKTNMKNFFDVLWCQRYGVIGNKELRGINPVACSLCKLKSTCVGLSKMSTKTVLISNALTPESFCTLSEDTLKDISFICLLENNVPKKVYKKGCKKGYYSWTLIDEFSGYLMRENDCLPDSAVVKGIVTVDEFVKYYERR